MDVRIIVAASQNNCIGINGKLPWHLPTDLKYFKELTTGNVVVMGRKTYESIGKVLPNRINVIATRKENYQVINGLVDSDIWSHLESWNLPIFIIGGGEIYKQAFKYANTFYLTRIYSEILGDTYLEGFVEDEWVLMESSKIIEENGLKFQFLKFKKK